MSPTFSCCLTSIPTQTLIVKDAIKADVYVCLRCVKPRVASDIFAKDGVHRRLQVLYRPASKTNNAKPFKLILEVDESESRHFLFYIKMIFLSFYFPVSVACQS